MIKVCLLLCLAFSVNALSDNSKFSKIYLNLLLYFAKMTNILFLADSVELCETPDGLDGFCHPLVNCPVLNNMFLSKPVSPQNKRFLRNSQCGSREKGVIRVCCRKEAESAATLTQEAAPSP